MRTYPNVIARHEFDGYEDSHPFIAEQVESNYKTHVNISAEDFLEDTFIHFINLTYKVTVQATHLLQDSYMLDVDELQLGAFRFIRSG